MLTTVSFSAYMANKGMKWQFLTGVTSNLTLKH